MDLLFDHVRLLGRGAWRQAAQLGQGVAAVQLSALRLRWLRRRRP